jgi:hypothetical protein
MTESWSRLVGHCCGGIHEPIGEFTVIAFETRNIYSSASGPPFDLTASHGRKASLDNVLLRWGARMSRQRPQLLRHQAPNLVLDCIQVQAEGVPPGPRA